MEESQSSSEDDIEQFNIFQKARKVRAPNQLNSHKTSPARSPFRSPRFKTRKLNIVEERISEINWEINPQLEAPLNAPLNAPLDAPELDVPPEPEAPQHEAPPNAPQPLTEEVAPMEEAVPSSEPLDPNEIESLLKDSVKTPETIPLSQFVEENCGLLDLDEIEVTENEFVVHTESCTPCEKVEIEAVAHALRKLRLKTAQESQAIKALAQAPVDINHRPPLQQIQASSQLNAEISRQKIGFALLRDLRMRMLQTLNDTKHEQSQLEANERIYCQLYEQIEDAASLADHHKASAQKADSLAQDIQDQEAQNEEALTKLRQLEEDLGAQLSLMTKTTLKGASITVFPVAASSPQPNNYTAQLDRLTKTLGVTASIESDELAQISTCFFSIRVHLTTDHLDYHFSYPSAMRAVGDHYKQIILAERSGIRKSVQLWNRALALSRAITELQKQHPMLGSDYDSDLQVTKLRFYPQTSVELHGTSVIIDTELDTATGPLHTLKQLNS